MITFVRPVLVVSAIAAVAAVGSTLGTGASRTTAAPEPAAPHTAAPQPAAPQPPAPRLPPLVRLLGQRIMVGQDGTRADADLLARVRHGQVGGVILYRYNIVTPAGVRALADTLLAPVVDIPTGPPSLTLVQGRSFSSDPRRVALYASAFADGMQAGGVAGTAKHFPGAGAASVNTDNQLAELRLTPTQLRAALVPFRALIRARVDAVMLANAGSPAYDPTVAPSALSRRLTDALLRGQLGFRGMTITDALGAPTGHTEVGGRLPGS